MPTETGAETIGERLTRLRAERESARQVVARVEGVGQSWSMGGTAITAASYDAALRRISKLDAEIRALESRLTGVPDRSNIAVTRTNCHD